MRMWGSWARWREGGRVLADGHFVARTSAALPPPPDRKKIRRRRSANNGLQEGWAGEDLQQPGFAAEVDDDVYAALEADERGVEAEVVVRGDAPVAEREEVVVVPARTLFLNTRGRPVGWCRLRFALKPPVAGPHASSPPAAAKPIPDRCPRNRHSTRFFWTPVGILGCFRLFCGGGVHFYCTRGRFCGHLSKIVVTFE